MSEEQGASDAACDRKQANTDRQQRGDNRSEDQNQEQKGHRKGDELGSVQVVLERLVKGLIDRHLAGGDNAQGTGMYLTDDLADVALRLSRVVP